MIRCNYLVYDSDCGEKVFDLDNRVSVGAASIVVQADYERSADWRKSSWSASNGNCVEVAMLRHGLVGVRDSKEAGQGPVLVFEGAAWMSFIESVKIGS
jgi:uncharacterized protein DUF397